MTLLANLPKYPLDTTKGYLGMKPLTTKQFIEKAQSIHPRYDYTRSEYKNQKTKVTVGCPDHGWFTVLPKTHTRSSHPTGCPSCGNNNKKLAKLDTLETFIQKAQSVHGDYYDYSKVVYEKSNKKVEIICPIHGSFFKRPNGHITGKQGCPICGTLSGADKQKLTHKEVVSRISTLYDNRYDVIGEYTNITDTIEVKCSIHNDVFYPVANNILNGKEACPECAKHKHASNIRRVSWDEFLAECNIRHFEKYEYIPPSGEFFLQTSKIDIRCPEHGEFRQRAVDHWNYRGCPKCSTGTSRGELEILKFINELGISGESRMKIFGIEYDIMIPSYNLLIEYCGNYWHSELQGKTRSYHIDKLLHAQENGYRLLTIFEDEWENKQLIVKSRLRNILGKSDKGVGARKTKIREITYNEARDFINQHHIQGSPKQMKWLYGAFHNDILVAVMTFSPGRKSVGLSSNVIELVRFVTDGRNYPGIAGKLLKHFIRIHPGMRVITFADRRWSIGSLYTSLGFQLDGNTPPNYWYIGQPNYLTRKHRFGYQKSKIVDRFNADSSKTEWEIMQENGFDRIWDCGNLKYMLLG